MYGWMITPVTGNALIKIVFTTVNAFFKKAMIAVIAFLFYRPSIRVMSRNA